MKKTLAILLTLLVVVTLVFPASAVERSDLTPMDMNPIDMESPDEINDLTVRSTVTQYFSERLAFLKGESASFETANIPVRNDEDVHRMAFSETGFLPVSSAVVINSIHCESLFAKIELTETMHYLSNGNSQSETVAHKITVAPNDNGDLVVISDAYKTDVSDFTSCSYVPDSMEHFSVNAAGGSGHCMVDIAEQEIGVTETGVNYTKYGEWYSNNISAGSNGLDWCAMFVVWCAGQCNVSTTAVPQTRGANVMKDYYAGLGRFNASSAYGGTVAPVAGDLFFEGSSLYSISHVGIIVAVDSTYIYVVDGNCENRVNSHSIRRDSSSYVGFARPGYAKASHTANTAGGWYYSSTQHWHRCEHCNLPADSASHTLGSWQIDTEQHWKKCSVCQGTVNTASHTYGNWVYDSTSHWKACSGCGYKIYYATHTTTGGWLYDSNQHWKACSVCGGKASAASHTFTASYCSVCRYNPNVSTNGLHDFERSPL